MEAAEVYLGSSTVPAAVVMVVKYKAYLSVGRLIIGISAQLVIYSGRRHIGIRAYISTEAVYTGTKE